MILDVNELTRKNVGGKLQRIAPSFAKYLVQILSTWKSVALDMLKRPQVLSVRLDGSMQIQATLASLSENVNTYRQNVSLMGKISHTKTVGPTSQRLRDSFDRTASD